MAFLEIHSLIREVPSPGSQPLRILDIPELLVPAGQQLLLTGPSGSGKTTLLHLIAGLISPTSGEICFDGRRVDSMAQKERDRWRAENLGYIFQRLNLLDPLTVEENVMLPGSFAGGKNRRVLRDRAHELLALVGLEGKAGSYPGKLSGGEQQRVAVVRALFCRPRLVLADEPTASLDLENAEKVLVLLRELCLEGGATLLLSTHDPSVMARFSQRYDLRKKELL